MGRATRWAVWWCDVPLALAAAWGCGAPESASGPWSASGTADATTSATGEATGEASTSGAASRSDADATTSADDDGPKLDLAVPLGPPTCENLDEFPPTSLGCEFWAIDFGVAPVEGLGGLGISVGNPSHGDATVRLEDLRGPGGSLRLLQELVLAPSTSRMLPINVNADSLLPGEDHTVAIGFNGAAAFRIRSDVPITATQINPVENAESYVPDASLLLPTNALDTTYFALGYSWDQVAIVAVADGTTVTTEAGDALLDAFDTHVVFAEDATGFAVFADKPVAVFSGTPCTEVPIGTPSCDHLEEQVLPVAAWGTQYVGARHPPRLPELNPEPEPVTWRVVAAVDDVHVSLTPAQPDVGTGIDLLEAGDFVEFASTTHFVATADDAQPFMLVEYMQGGTVVCPPPGTCAAMNEMLHNGDPSMLQMTPTDQWVARVPFMTDTTYAHDFVVVARSGDTEVTLDCFGVVPDERFAAIGNTDFAVATVDLDRPGVGGEGTCVDGSQLITADRPVGVFVGGIEYAASYLYPAGLNVESLWRPPDGPRG